MKQAIVTRTGAQKTLSEAEVDRLGAAVLAGAAAVLGRRSVRELHDG